MEPATSANRTVICFLSAEAGTAWAEEDRPDVEVAEASADPHSAQKFSPSSTGAPQVGQVLAGSVPHFVQNLAPWRFS
jgi:hypothetical protein